MTATPFRLSHLNIYGSRFTSAADWLKRRDQVAKRLIRTLDDATEATSSIYTLNECTASEAEWLAGKLGGGFKAVNYQSVSILYGKAWTLAGTQKVPFTSAHGAIVTQMQREGHTINISSAHLNPHPWNQTLRENSMKKLAAALKAQPHPTVIGGDFNWFTGFEKYAASLGYQSARRVAPVKTRDNYRTHGTFKVGNPIDFVLLNGIEARSYRLLEGWGSDHHMITTQLTIPA